MKEITSPRPGLVRALGPVTATAVVVGGIIGSGIFKKPQVVAEYTPFFGLAALVWVLGGVLALLGSLSLAEPAALYPRAGGNYVFLRESFGRLAAFLWGCVEFGIIRSAGLAALATMFAESLADILRNQAFQQAFGLNLGPEPLAFWGQRWLTIVVIMVLAFVNVLGVRWGGLLQLFITTIKVSTLIGVAVLPFVVAAVASSGSDVPRPDTQNLLPLWPSWNSFNLSKLGAALVAVLWAYHGWMDVAPVGGEVRNPWRNVPLAMVAGASITMGLYLAANLGYCLIMTQDQLAAVDNSTTAATVFSLKLLGPIGAAIASAAIVWSVFGALNGNLLVGPRVIYAMGEDGLAPRAMAAVHPRFRTPAAAIVVMGIWSALLILAGAALTRYRLPLFSIAGRTLDLNVPEGKALFNIMTDFCMFGAVVFETLAVATIFVFRRRFPNAERPYRCWGYPVVPGVYVLLMALVALNMVRTQTTEVLVGVSFVAVCAAVYALSPRLRRPVNGEW
jgi:basic amino acid/polyamine antiporter, APA family